MSVYHVFTTLGLNQKTFCAFLRMMYRRAHEKLVDVEQHWSLKRI